MAASFRFVWRLCFVDLWARLGTWYGGAGDVYEAGGARRPGLIFALYDAFSGSANLSFVFLATVAELHVASGSHSSRDCWSSGWTGFSVVSLRRRTRKQETAWSPEAEPRQSCGSGCDRTRFMTALRISLGCRAFAFGFVIVPVTTRQGRRECGST